MNFAERIPSNEWTALTLMGDVVAEAWFKPDGEPWTLVLRVPQERFLIDFTEQSTLEDLLKAAAVSNDEVESWQLADEFHSSQDGTNPELQRLLPPPAPDATHLAITVRLKSPTRAANSDEHAELVVPTEELWQALEARWKAILGVEGSIESLRQSTESLRSEMEAAIKQTINAEQKVHALQSDVAQWNKAKSRVHYALPKVREFIHRATWALGVPERKRLEEVFKNHIEPRIPFPQMEKELEKLEHLQKDRQVLSATGNAVGQECRGITSEIQRALSTLQRNAADNAQRKRSNSKAKGKFF